MLAQSQGDCLSEGRLCISAYVKLFCRNEQLTASAGTFLPWSAETCSAYYRPQGPRGTKMSSPWPSKLIVIALLASYCPKQITQLNITSKGKESTAIYDEWILSIVVIRVIDYTG